MTPQRPHQGVPRRVLRAVAICLLVLCALGASAQAAGAAAKAPHASAKASRWNWSQPYTVRGMSDSVNDLSCPSVSLCVAVSGTDVFWSRNPRGGSSTWKKAALPVALEIANLDGQTYAADGVSCPTSSFCVAIDEVGNTYVSTDPTGGTGAWLESEINIQTYPGLESISCASRSLCGALDITGEALTTTTPAGVPPLWGSVKISATKQADHYGISCASGARLSLCAAVESDHELALSADPRTAPASWQVAKTPSKALNDVTCPTASLCVAAGDSALLLLSHTPTVLRSWTPFTLAQAHGAEFTSIVCHGGSLCLASTDFGQAALSTAPSATASAWQWQGQIDLASITALACPTARLCFVGDSNNQIVIGRP
jgi:hypothetical protein